MNERLEQEWKSYCDKQGTGTMISVNVKDVAQHFYNLALEDVRKEVEMKIESHSKRQNTVAVIALQSLKDFIEALAK